MAKLKGDITTLHETRKVLLPVGEPSEKDGEITQKHLELEIQALPPNIFLILQKELPGDDDEDKMLQDIASIYKALRPGQIDFEAVEPEEDANKTDFYRAILDELGEIGFSFNHYKMLVNEILDLTGVKAKDVEAAEEDFTTEESVEAES